jgi:hypothetical protein
MPSIITAAQLRAVLGVSSSLYNDAYLEEIIGSAEAVILPMLTANQAAIAEVYLTSSSSPSASKCCATGGTHDWFHK